MNEAEIMQAISKKQVELEEKRSQNAGEAVAVLEKELMDLMDSLTSAESERKKQQHFEDDCKG